MNIGKLDVDFTLDELLIEIENNDFEILQIENEYLKNLSNLPFINKDPLKKFLKVQRRGNLCK